MGTRFAISVAVISALACNAVTRAATRVDVDGLFARLDTRLRNRVAEMNAAPTVVWPRYRDASSGTWTAQAPGWDGGYFPGLLWQMYRRTDDPQYQTWARKWTNAIMGLGPNDPIPADLTAYNFSGLAHDVGLIYLTSFGEGHRATHDYGYARVMFKAAQALGARYDTTKKVIRSWDWGPWTYPVIIDGMMSVQTLSWSVEHGGSANDWFVAANHALTTARNQMRPDGSTFHVVDYGTTTPTGSTFQGYSDTSTWARGQAWAIHGFAESYGAIGDKRLLDASRRAADYWIAHTDADPVPLWDFSLPADGDPSLYVRDSSAAAIAASGLIDLSTKTTVPAEQRSYFQQAETILNRLASSAYFAADAPGETRGLLHGVVYYNGNVGRDASLIYADYYFAEALERYEAAFPGPGIAAGDATRDGIVNFNDLLVLAQHYNTASVSWLEGDFTRDGKVNFDDLLALSQRYVSGSTFSADWALAQALVPEPAFYIFAALYPLVRRGRSMIRA